MELPVIKAIKEAYREVASYANHFMVLISNGKPITLAQHDSLSDQSNAAFIIFQGQTLDKNVISLNALLFDA